jgi:hypothetical protein
MDEGLSTLSEEATEGSQVRHSRAWVLVAGLAGAVGAALGTAQRAGAVDGSGLTLGNANTSTAATTVANNGTDVEAFEITATGDGTDGVVGLSQGAPTAGNPDPTGVVGVSSNGDGVLGFTAASNFAGVAGLTNASATYGVVGVNTSGVAGAVGALGESDAGYGVFGVSTSGSGVVGSSSSGPGLQGFSTSQTGLTGSSNSTYGTFGSSQSGPGLGGFSTSSYGGFFQTQNGSQWAAYVNNAANGNGLVVNGNFVVMNGNKSAAVEVGGDLHLMYAVEAPESLFEDTGRAKLVRGRARVELDPLFAKTIETGEYHLFLTPGSAASKGLGVAHRDKKGFEVRELHDGRGSYEFDYRIVAARKGFDRNRRLAKMSRPEPPAPIERALLVPPKPAPGQISRTAKRLEP